MDAIKKDLGKIETCDYNIWFPWHVHWEGEVPEFTIYGYTFEPAEESEWRPQLEQIADAPDVSDGYKLLKKIEDGDYDIWKTTISGRTPRWAMVQFKNAIEILSAQLNHSAYFMNYETRADRLVSSSWRTKEGGRWTAIHRPFGVFYAGEHVDEHPYTPHWGANIYVNREYPIVNLDYSLLRNRLDHHLCFEDIQVGQEPLLHNVLVDYQQGLTESDHRRSFINFWRVIEELSLAGQGQKEETVERALYALEVVSDGDYDPIFETVANEIWDVRNTRTHETGWIRIGTEHEIATKVLADAMLELYLTEFVEPDGSFDKSKTRRILKWATKNKEIKKETIEALNAASDITNN